jgi:hypothetical protein
MKGWRIYLLPGVAALLVLFYYLAMRSDPASLGGADTPPETRPALPGANAPPRRAPTQPDPTTP